MSIKNLNSTELAKLTLSCLDLTELSDSCTAENINSLCQKAQGFVEGKKQIPQTPAVCVWPAWVALSRKLLPTNIKIASVVNFPTGDFELTQTQKEIELILCSAGDEIDWVFPYKNFLAGDNKYCENYIREVRKHCGVKTLKVIFESGAFLNQEKLMSACELCLDNGADFLKTSTGKIPQGADINSAKIMVTSINNYLNKNPTKTLSLKPSGGLKVVADVVPYMQIIEDNWGFSAINSIRFRIGASGIWNNIVETILDKKLDNQKTPSY